MSEPSSDHVSGPDYKDRTFRIKTDFFPGFA